MAINSPDKELWKWVVGYEGLYMVSNHGRVMSVPKTIVKSNGRRQTCNGQMLKQALTTKGYPHIVLNKDGVGTSKPIHRLVAEAFIPNEMGLPSVNHIDENKLNNRVENLEWVSVEYNNSYGTRNKRISGTLSKPVQMISDGAVVEEFSSTVEAKKKTGAQTSHISECCNGLRKSAKGFSWKYKEAV